MGRKSKTDTVLKNLDTIKQLKAKGATDVQIAKHIGVCPATFYKILKESPELQEALDEGVAKVIEDLTGELYKKARVHSLTTTKTVVQGDKVMTETIIKEVDSDTAAITFLLRNLDSKNWSNDPEMLKLKKRELELKEKNAEFQNF